MAAPEHQVAALQKRRPVCCFEHHAEPPLLHVGVARARDASRGQRHLHEAGTVDAVRRLAAPQIRRADKSFRDRDKVGRTRPDLGEMGREHSAAVDRMAKSPRCATTPSSAPNGRTASGGSFMFGPG